MTSSSESDYSSKKSRSRHRTRTQRVDSDRDDGRRRKREIKEEDIIEYMAKKAQKKAMKNAKKLKSQPISGYSNDSNPFGDSNLNEQFLWRKKLERDISQGQVPDMSTKAEKKRHRERMAEIEKVKKRREERAIEKAQREEEQAMLARERARAEFQDWEKKEEEGLTVKELEELRDDIKMHLDLDRATSTHIEFWEYVPDQALIVVCDWELAEARKRDACDRARVRGEEPPAEVLAEERGLHSSIDADVRDLLQGKTSSELEMLQHQIESQMRSGTAMVVEYWEAVLKRLQIYKAKMIFKAIKFMSWQARLREIHADLLRRHLKRLEHPVENTDNIESDDIPMLNEDDAVLDVEDARPYSPAPVNIEEQDELEEEPGSFSPELFHGDEDGEAIDPEEDKIELEQKRMAVLEEQQKRIREAMARKPIPSEDSLEMKAMKAMGVMEEGDAVFGSGAEVNLDSQVYWWHDKYRPRKPKYFNRVHTGYEWNKYNQTHYDHDNPPPKIVQGYKFNIFYPDLVDKTKAPVYTIEKDGSSGETCFIRFHAGPPYEDIAFRIVNKEWEYSHKKGFKCTFERGILHVYFNFKRYRYRR
ncbi:hypothetical protein QJS10_CPB13g00571 [Acorus calamus]|uniref:Splicing factor Cactin n=1 Tax=Acorus calamus TaxID=4465 RepID=A0AAV9DG73_ACOCL|nr:hypothetical protein QJS10_CPB13g00571 [Acorus calamus]